ncbi:MAG: phosphate ABC transporter substrate-binding protein PstS [Pigmentiphaga sp.]|nr:phosphate ABC transporter substrate-binding protein PstS [Pigmentiphaga sp.]
MSRPRRLTLCRFLPLLLALAAPWAHALNITGAGASFPFPVYAFWAHEYRDAADRLVNYQSIGSGGGVAQITRGTVDFGATDAPLDGEELAERGLVQFPSVLGGTVPVVNIPGIAPGELKLTGAELADIFLGKIRKWNDPVLVARNPGLELPDAEILVVHRSDGSGTTYGWTHYLAQVSPEWASQVGVGKAVKWPTGQGGKGNEGVANYVRQLQNTIGFVEYGFARQSGLSHVSLQNREGNFVQPNAESFMAAAANADWEAVPGMGVMLTNQPGAEAWPLAAATYILVPTRPDTPERVRVVFDFFDWAFRHGDDTAERLHYVALPDNVADLVRQSWTRDVRPRNGQSAWP